MNVHHFHSINTTWIKEWLSFFLVRGEWIWTRDEQIAKRFSDNLFVLRSDSFPIIPEKGTHFLYLQCFHQRSFQKFSEKRYKFKLLLFTETLTLIWCKSLRVWFGQLANYFMTVLIGNRIENFRVGKWRKYDTIVNIKIWTIQTGMEWVGPSKRSLAGLVITCFGPFGTLYLGLMAYLLRDWIYIEIAVAVPVVLTLLLWWYEP